MKRVFLALDLPEHIKRQVELIAISMRDKIRSQECAKAKFVLMKELYHITLHFFGRLTQEQIDYLIHNFDENIDNIKGYEYTAELEKIGFFKGIKHSTPIRVVWIGVKIENFNHIITNTYSIIREFYNIFAKSLSNRTIKKTKQSMDIVPHVTIARVKSVSDLTSFIEIIKQLDKKLRMMNDLAKSFKIPSLVLYESKLTNSGPLYSVIKKWDL